MRSRKRIVGLGLAVAAVVLSGCASTGPSAYHRYLMRGTITDIQGADVVFCTGRPAAARVGQELQVVKSTRRPNQPSNPAAGVKIDHEAVGSVRITEMVDAHHARAKVVSGRMREGFVVELEPDGPAHSTSGS